MHREGWAQVPGQLIQWNKGPGQEANRWDVLSGSFPGVHTSQGPPPLSTEVLRAQCLTGNCRGPHRETVGH